MPERIAFPMNLNAGHDEPSGKPDLSQWTCTIRFRLEPGILVLPAEIMNRYASGQRSCRIADSARHTWSTRSGAGGDYFPQHGGETHWLVDSLIANPMSGYAHTARSARAGASACSARWWSRSRPKTAWSASPPASAACRPPG